jgi:hypothetical protein
MVKSSSEAPASPERAQPASRVRDTPVERLIEELREEMAREMLSRQIGGSRDVPSRGPVGAHR